MSFAVRVARVVPAGFLLPFSSHAPIGRTVPRLLLTRRYAISRSPSSESRPACRALAVARLGEAATAGRGYETRLGVYPAGCVGPAVPA